MDSNRQASLRIQDEAEIDLIDVFIRLLIQWRPIMVISIICGVLVFIISYQKDISRYHEELAEREEILSAHEEEERERQEQLADAKKELQEAQKKQEQEKERLEEEEKNRTIDDLKGDEIVSVEEAIQKQVRLNQIIESKNNSIQYTLDPYNKRSLSIRYYISDAKNSDLASIKDYYMTFSCGESMRSAIAASYSDIQPKDLNGMLTASTGYTDNYADNVDGFFSVSFNLLDNMDSDKTAQTINNVLQKIQPTVSSQIGSHTLRKVFVDEQTYIDTNLRDQQTSIDNDIASARNDLRSAISTLSDVQFSFFLQRTNEENIDTDYTENDIGIVNTVKETPENGLDLSTTDIEENSAENDEDEELEDIVIPSYSVKNLILGLLLGVFLFGFIEIIKILLNPAIYTADGFSDISGIRTFGEIRQYPYTKKWQKFWYDKKLYHRIRKKYLFNDAHQKEISDLMTAYLQHSDISDFYFVSLTQQTEFEHAFYSQLTASLKSVQNQIEQIDLSSMDPSQIENTFFQTHYVFLLLSIGRSKYKDISAFFEICNQHQVQICGTIFTEG